MNEEWWGVCAKGAPDAHGLFELYPRAAFYALRRAFELEPYGGQTDLEAIRAHFTNIHPASAVLEARGDRASFLAESRVRISELRLKFDTFTTNGSYD